MEKLSDRELLELAALAAGLTGYVGESIAGLYFCVPANPSLPHSYPEIYDWLKDDAGAFRLAVKLGINVWQYLKHEEVCCGVDHEDYDVPLSKISSSEAYGDDPYAATRRAIVRAAAAIGQSMKEQGK